MSDTTPDSALVHDARKGALLGRYGEQLALPMAWLGLIIFFSLMEPDLFPTSRNLGSLLGTQTALFIIALAALLPAMAGDLDLSLGWTGALGAMVMAVLNTKHDWNIVTAALVALVIGAACGTLNGFVVVKLKTEPFIMTLGTGALFQGFVLLVSDSQTMTNVSRSLSSWTYGHRIWVIPIQFFYAVAIMLVIWWVAQHTPLGVRWLFVGKSRDVARLSGINSDRIRWGAFIAAGTLSAFAAVVFVGNSGSMSPVSFYPYLLPAYAAVFLGATTIHPGRFNPIGTMIAVLFLATGIQGLRIMGADDFAQAMFYGVTLIIAVAGSRYLRGK
ncbi:MAG TPA: ABC transporter permease [Ilumatobacter sp.]|nr:ABC transporter permease [Ilumatobacter sp.]